MKFIKQDFKIVDINKDALKLIEFAGRNCYNSHHKITEDSCDQFVRNLIKRNHTAMLEFADMFANFTSDRTTTHELVRHRICSFAQESQRYVKYENIEYILPPWLPNDYLGDWTYNKLADEKLPYDHQIFINGLLSCELVYQELIKGGWEPEKARKILPGSTASKICIKTNFREWLHIFNLRVDGTTGRPDPTIRNLLDPLLQHMIEHYGPVFNK